MTAREIIAAMQNFPVDHVDVFFEDSTGARHEILGVDWEYESETDTARILLHDFAK